MTFILILTLIGNTSQSGQAIATVPGFTSMQACLDSGNSWVKQAYETDSSRPARALCMEQKK